MLTDRDSIRFNVLRNALYHTARRRSLERSARWLNFLVVLLGAAAVGDVLNAYRLARPAVGLAVSVIGALQLVWDFGRQARDHQALQRDYYSLLADIEASNDQSSEKCGEWHARMIRITADEPPVLRAVDAKAYNDALDAMGTFSSDQRLHIPVTHRYLSGFLAFDGHNYLKQCEMDRRPIFTRWRAALSFKKDGPPPAAP
ncbi:hypothetical protein [Cereibacter johrii]|uniref:hypothetical protein n=1 Tax=Cereibacter johrii TaxID=445629 RepID=UPI002B260A10|nr:hypothetical protein [Cereibacter johrii]MEA5160723.1 hypothetical protein [Cereibacter johrii]